MTYFLHVDGQFSAASSPQVVCGVRCILRTFGGGVGSSANPGGDGEHSCQTPKVRLE